MKIVLDTNVLIAAFISHGTCNELLEHCVHNHEAILSLFIIDQFTEKLTGKFGFTHEEANSAVNLLKSRFEVKPPLQLPRQICRDSDDDMIIGTALAAGCECIVTGDKDLLELRNVNGIHIVSPSKFWEFEK